jgi:Ca2+-binding RTX toxin-like protein
LEVGEIVDGFGSIDIVSDIDQVIGTKFSDWISGDDEPNALDGLGGDDFLSGGGGGDRLYGDSGNDTLIGGGGFDIARYENSPAGIVVDMRLANNQVQDGFGSLDKLSRGGSRGC